MKLSSDSLLNEFFLKETENFPGVSLEKIKEIVHHPWKHLKSVMEDGELNSFRMKYFGIFQVYQGKAKGHLRIVEKSFELGNITEERYRYIKGILKKHLEKWEEK